MKAWIVLFGLTLGSLAGFSAPAWFPQSSGTFQSLLAVDAPSRDTVYAVGFFGAIARTTNGGTTWATDFDTSFATLRTVKCLNSVTCLAAGDYGKILKTTNAGVTWVHLNSGKTTTIYTLALPTATTHYGSTQSPVGTVSSIVKTTNGGTSTWTAQGTGSFRWPLFSLHCFDANNCMSGGENRTMVVTTNGGTNWNSATSPPANTAATSNQNVPVTALHCLSATTCFGAGGTGIFVKTTNSGTASANLTTSTSTKENLRSFHFFDANRAVLAGDSGILMRTANGWTSHTRDSTGTTLGLWGVSFANDTTGWIVGDNGLILKYGTAPVSVSSEARMSDEMRVGIVGRNLVFDLKRSARVDIRFLDYNGKTLSAFTRNWTAGEHVMPLPQGAGRGRILDFRIGAARRILALQ